jgi:hypothetical protein
MDKLLEQCESYHVENDPTGDQGRSLADRCFQTYGTFNIKDIIERQQSWEKWRAIAFRRFSLLLSGETILVREIRERLTELKKSGYDIQSGYSRLKKKEAWAYLRRIQRKLSLKS